MGARGNPSKRRDPEKQGKKMKKHSYENETKDLFAKLQGAGFRLVSVDNGEELTKWADVDAETFLAETMACDESTLRVVNPQGQGRALWLVYGNGPGELVCDYTDAPDLSAVVDACCASAQEGGAL